MLFAPLKCAVLENSLQHYDGEFVAMVENLPLIHNNRTVHAGAASYGIYTAMCLIRSIKLEQTSVHIDIHAHDFTDL